MEADTPGTALNWFPRLILTRRQHPLLRPRVRLWARSRALGIEERGRLPTASLVHAEQTSSKSCLSTSSNTTGFRRFARLQHYVRGDDADGGGCDAQRRLVRGCAVIGKRTRHRNSLFDTLAVYDGSILVGATPSRSLVATSALATEARSPGDVCRTQNKPYLIRVGGLTSGDAGADGSTSDPRSVDPSVPANVVSTSQTYEFSGRLTDTGVGHRRPVVSTWKPECSRSRGQQHGDLFETQTSVNAACSRAWSPAHQHQFR